MVAARLDPERLRTEVRDAVIAHVATTERERRSRERILAGLDALAAPFDREADSVHITGSAIVLGPPGTLLHRHKRLGIWMQPGGHVDAGEAPWEAALRETHEETGIAARHPNGVPQLIHLDVHPAGAHLHLDLRYLLEADVADPAPGPDESQEVAWFSLAEAIALADEALVEALERLARNVGT